MVVLEDDELEIFNSRAPGEKDINKSMGRAVNSTQVPSVGQDARRPHFNDDANHWVLWDHQSGAYCTQTKIVGLFYPPEPIAPQSEVVLSQKREQRAKTTRTLREKQYQLQELGTLISTSRKQKRKLQKDIRDLEKSLKKSR